MAEKKSLGSWLKDHKWQPRHVANNSAAHRIVPGQDLKSWLKDTAIVVVVALGLSALIKAFLVQAFYVPSGSMENTIQIGDRVLVSKLTPGFRSLKRGDIVVFKDPGNWLESRAQEKENPLLWALSKVGLWADTSNDHLIKRVIGLPGDTVKCCTSEGKLSVNGVAVDESSFLKPGTVPSQFPFKVTVPRGKLWVMGDNRSNSEDSRFHMNSQSMGFVPLRDVTGKAELIWWPYSHWRWFDGQKNFEKVPAPPAPPKTGKVAGGPEYLYAPLEKIEELNKED